MSNLKIKKNNIDTPKKFWVKDKIVACDGGEDFGHPLIYLNIAKSGKVVCPYCSKIFVLKK